MVHTRTGKATIRCSASLPPSPRRDEANDGVDSLEQESALINPHGAQERREESRSGEIPDPDLAPLISPSGDVLDDDSAEPKGSSEESFGSAAPNDSHGNTADYHVARGNSRALVLRTAPKFNISGLKIFPSWFADAPREVRVKIEPENTSVPFDWAESDENDPLPDVMDLIRGRTRFEKDLRKQPGHEILSARMAKISKFKDHDDPTGSDASESESDVSSRRSSVRSLKSISGKYKRPLRPGVAVFSAGAGPSNRPYGPGDVPSDSDGDRIPFRSKEKWPAYDSATPKIPSQKAWVSEELENEREAQVEQDHEYATYLQDLSDREARSQRQANCDTIKHLQWEAQQKRASKHRLASPMRAPRVARSKSSNEAGRRSRRNREDGSVERTLIRERDRKNRKLECYRLKRERENLRETRRAERRIPITARRGHLMRPAITPGRLSRRAPLPEASSIHRAIYGKSASGRYTLPGDPDDSSSSSSSSDGSGDDDPRENPFDRAPESNDS